MNGGSDAEPDLRGQNLKKSLMIYWNNVADCKGMRMRPHRLTSAKHNEAVLHKIRSGFTELYLASKNGDWPHRMRPFLKNEASLA